MYDNIRTIERKRLVEFPSSANTHVTAAARSRYKQPHANIFASQRALSKSARARSANSAIGAFRVVYSRRECRARQINLRTEAKDRATEHRARQIKCEPRRRTQRPNIARGALLQKHESLDGPDRTIAPPRWSDVRLRAKRQ
jgi:hypothetical protein